jgi:hypothetical protein
MDTMLIRLGNCLSWSLIQAVRQYRLTFISIGKAGLLLAGWPLSTRTLVAVQRALRQTTWEIRPKCPILPRVPADTRRSRFISTTAPSRTSHRISRLLSPHTVNHQLTLGRRLLISTKFHATAAHLLPQRLLRNQLHNLPQILLRNLSRNQLLNPLPIPRVNQRQNQLRSLQRNQH